MKSKLLAFLLAALFHAPALLACDACGCSILFANMGLTPHYQRKALGLGWQRQVFHSFATVENSQAGRADSKEFFQQANLQLQWPISRTLHVTAQLPYAFLNRALDNQQQRLNGLSDASALLQWTPINTGAKMLPDSTLHHRLSVGLGVKMPTGSNIRLNDEPSGNPNFNLGTGTWDALLYLQYVLRSGNWGGSIDAFGAINSTASDAYRYGNRLAANVAAFGVFRQGELTIMPITGGYLEAADNDIQRGFYREDTGGHYLFWRNELQLYWRKYSVSLQYKTPLSQSWAQGLTQAHDRIAVQCFMYW